MWHKKNIASDQSNTNYDIGNEIFYNTDVLKSNPFNWNEAYILVRADITIIGDNNVQKMFTIHKMHYKN